MIKEELKTLLIETLDLEDITPSEIEDDMQLFGEEGLGLDSIDALEIGVAIQKKYSITIDPEESEVREKFSTINDLSNLIESNLH